MPAKLRLPKTIGGTIDAMFKNRQTQQEIGKQLSAAKEDYKALENHAFENFAKDNLEGGRGKLAQASISRKVVPQVEDWDTLYKYISRTKSFDLLQKRLSTMAVNQRWDDKKKVPGVDSFTKISISLTKVKAK